MGLVHFLKRIIRPRPNEEAELAFKRGTHLPVLEALFEVFRPGGVLELGAGTNSTPFFHEHAAQLVTVETDAVWVGRVSQLCPARAGFRLVHHRLPQVASKTKMHAIPLPVRHGCIAFYRSLLEEHPDLNVLFIDHVDGLRGICLAGLHDSFDFVIYHDAEDPCYGYNQLAAVDSGRHLHFVLRTFLPHTGIMIDKRYADALPRFVRVLDEHARRYFSARYRFDLQEVAASTVHGEAALAAVS